MRVVAAMLLLAHSATGSSDTETPTSAPTFGPTPFPSQAPTHRPTQAPSPKPSLTPTVGPTPYPSQAPTRKPTLPPSFAPTHAPSHAPTQQPTKPPTAVPTAEPSLAPSGAPTDVPTEAPTDEPSPAPTKFPTKTPTQVPSPPPSFTPVPTPATPKPSALPTHAPTALDSVLFYTAGDATSGTTLSSFNPNREGATGAAALLAAATGSAHVYDGVAFGVVNGEKRIFYTNSAEGTVSSMTFDGGNRTVVLSGLSSPRAISISLGSSWLFVTGDKKHGITRAPLDGSNAKVLVDHVPGITGVVAADTEVYFCSDATNTLYGMASNGDHFYVVARGLASPQAVAYLPGEVERPWSKAGEVEGFKAGVLYVLGRHDLSRCNTHGRSFETLVSGIGSGYSVSVDAPNGVVYWSDYNGTGVFGATLQGDNVHLAKAATHARGVCWYSSWAADSWAPSHSPTKAPTPRPTGTRYPSPVPSLRPTFAPTPEPTWVYNSILFSAGEGSYGLMKYIEETDTYTKMSQLAGEQVSSIVVDRRRDEEPMVWFTDAAHDALFKVPLIGQAMTLPTLVVAGCLNASALTIPKGQSYAYIGCMGWRGNITGESPDGRRTSIAKINLDGSGLEVVADSLGHITALSATDFFVYFCEKSGSVKYVDLAGSGLQLVADGFDNPSGLVVSAKAFLDEPVMYVSEKTAIWRVAVDGSSKAKVVKDLWNCKGLALDLAHDRLLWADKDANYIYSSELDGESITEEVAIKHGMGVTFYTSTAAMATKQPSHLPSPKPTPEPTKFPEPTTSPSAQPTLQPTLAPTYYEGKLYVSAGSSKSGINLYAADANDVSSPVALTSGFSGVRGVAWSRGPPHVFWIDEDSGSIKKASVLRGNYGDPDTIYTSSDALHDLAVDEDWVYVCGGAANSVVRMAHDGSSATTLLTGIASVTGIATQAYFANPKVYFTSDATGSVYSMGVAGGNLTTVVAGLSAPNDVVYDVDYDKLYIVCATEVVLASEDGSSSTVLMSGFSQATSLALHEYGDQKLWVADYGASVVYEASFDGETVTSAISSLTAPRSLSFYWSTASRTADPTHAPSTGPTEAPSEHPTHAPTHLPAPQPSAPPSQVPSPAPTTGPTPFPSEVPSPLPTSAPTATPAYLYFATGRDSSDGKVWRANADGSNATAFYSGGLPTSLAVETNLQYVFWTDSAAGAVYRSGLEATDAAECEAIVTGLAKPKQLTVSYDHSDDTEGPHVFWTDEDEGAVYRSGLDGEAVTVMVSGVDGIGGVVATYEYLYYTVPSSHALYKISFDCDGANDGKDDDCTPVQVLIGICDEAGNAGPFGLAYSSETYLMYATCATSVVNVKAYSQEGSQDEPLATVVSGLASSRLNAVTYGWNAGGLYLAAFNMSAVYFFPKAILNYNGDADADDDSSSARSLANLTGYTTVVAHASLRSVALYSSGLVENVDDSTTTSSTARSRSVTVDHALVARLVANPATLFAAPLDAESFEPISDQRVVLQRLEQAAATYGAAAAVSTSSHAAGRRDLATNLAAAAKAAAASSSSNGHGGSSGPGGAPLGAAAAGAFFALFAFAAVSGGSSNPAAAAKQRHAESRRAAGSAGRGYAQLD